MILRSKRKLASVPPRSRKRQRTTRQGEEKQQSEQKKPVISVAEQLPFELWSDIFEWRALLKDCAELTEDGKRCSVKTANRFVYPLKDENKTAVRDCQTYCEEKVPCKMIGEDGMPESVTIEFPQAEEREEERDMPPIYAAPGEAEGEAEEGREEQGAEEEEGGEEDVRLAPEEAEEEQRHRHRNSVTLNLRWSAIHLNVFVRCGRQQPFYVFVHLTAEGDENDFHWVVHEISVQSPAGTTNETHYPGDAFDADDIWELVCYYRNRGQNVVLGFDLVPSEDDPEMDYDEVMELLEQPRISATLNGAGQTFSRNYKIYADPPTIEFDFPAFGNAEKVPIDCDPWLRGAIQS